MIRTKPATPEYLDNFDSIFKMVEKEDREATCQHPRIRRTGHSHNDDCYECPECGYIEWR